MTKNEIRIVKMIVFYSLLTALFGLQTIMNLCVLKLDITFTNEYGLFITLMTIIGTFMLAVTCFVKTVRLMES